MRKIYFILTFLCFWGLAASSALAQQFPKDTLQLTLAQAEKMFLNENLALIIQRYEVDQAKAEVITARLFENPEFGFESNLYNPGDKRFFDYSSTGGQYAAQLSQLFLTAGKRNKNIQLAKISVQLSENQFYDLLRTLRYALRSNFYKIYFQQQSANVYHQEISSLQQTLKVFEQQYLKGNIAQKELLRIKSQLYSLQAELNELQQETEEVQAELKLLIRARPTTYIVPEAPPYLDQKEILSKLTYTQLLDSALNHRADLKIARTQVEYSAINQKLQQAMAIPDVTMSLSFDKKGNFIDNYSGIGISLPLPFFNRNQGAIKQAKIAVDASKAQLLNQQDLVENEVAKSFNGALRLENLYNSFDPKFREDFDHLINEVFKNYQKRNISLLEFLDFYSSYKENALQMNNLQLNRINSLEELNYVIGTQIFNQ